MSSTRPKGSKMTQSVARAGVRGKVMLGLDCEHSQNVEGSVEEWKQVRIQNDTKLEKTTPTEECERGAGSHRCRRRPGKSKPSFAADDCEGTETDVDQRDLLRARSDGILALATDVPGISDADGVLSRPSHSHRPYEQIFLSELS